MSMPDASIVLVADRVASRVTTRSKLSTRQYKEISKAPEAKWQPLAKAAEARGWTADSTRLAARNLEDERVPEARKKQILSGKADPVMFDAKGEMAVPADVAGRRIRDLAANDAVLALEKALVALGRLRLYRPEVIASTADRSTPVAPLATPQRGPTP